MQEHQGLTYTGEASRRIVVSPVAGRSPEVPCCRPAYVIGARFGRPDRFGSADVIRPGSADLIRFF